MKNPILFSRIFNTPLMIQATKLDAIVAGIGGRWNLIDAAPLADNYGGLLQRPLTPKAALTDKGERQGLAYYANGNVSVVPVVGVLAHRGGFQADSSFILGYNHIQAALTQALTDPSTDSILLEIDSPGGEVAGAFELAAQIKDAGKVKPVKAVVSSLAASAGYLIASAADEITISDTGIAGSIGVVMRHIDMSKAAEMDGISVTYIYAGGRKVDGNPFQPLPDSVKSDMQAQIDKLYSLFVTTVSTNRGLNTETVRAQQAAIYTGQDAINAGLADRISTPDAILAEMQSSFKSTRRSISMSNNDKPDAALEQQALEKARAESFEAGKKQGLAEGEVIGMKKQLDRIEAVTSHADYVGREATAMKLLQTTTMDAEAVIAVLATVPKATPAKTGQTEFEKHMAKHVGAVDIGAGNTDDDEGEGEETEEKLAANVVAIHHKLIGKK